MTFSSKLEQGGEGQETVGRGGTCPGRSEHRLFPWDFGLHHSGETLGQVSRIGVKSVQSRVIPPQWNYKLAKKAAECQGGSLCLSGSGLFAGAVALRAAVMSSV